MERDHPSNGNGSDPTAFTAHAKKRNNAGLRNQNHGRAGAKGRKGICYTCNKFGHYARECPNGRDFPRDDENNNFRGNGNERNNRFKGKRKAPSDRGGNGKPFKRPRNYRYDESNVVDNKKNEYIVLSSLSVASPLDTLDV